MRQRDIATDQMERRGRFSSIGSEASKCSGRKADTLWHTNERQVTDAKNIDQFELKDFYLIDESVISRGLREEQTVLLRNTK